MLIHRRQKTEQNHDESLPMKRLPYSSFRYFLTNCLFRSKFRRFFATQYGFLVLLAFVVVCFNEILFYQWMKFNWPEIKHLTNKPSVQKLLLIADPQLIGEKDEGFFGLITRKDADRYLAKTFAQANDYVEPDWILFLGDIFDEGLSANDDEFQRYFERFDSIFQYENREQKCLVIPGDNDVGGEYYGDKQPILRQRFRNYFGNTIALFKHKYIEYLKLDIDMFESYVNDKRSAIMEQTDNRSLAGPFRIVLNHWPLITRSARFVKPFLNDLEPNLILKGDSHHFHVFGLDRNNLTTYTLAREYLQRPILPLNLKQKRLIYEISVPTCSYRMGVTRIGYGVLLLDTDTNIAHLTILSTPRRYISLYLYAAYGIFFLLNVLYTSLFPRRSLFKFLMNSK